MAYQQKVWQNRLSEYPTRRLLTKVNEGDDTILVDVTREEGTIMQQGDAFSAANMNDLESRIAAGIGGGDENMAPIEQGPNSANPYAVNDLLIYNGQLYRVTKAIIVGNSLVSGVNITPTTVSKEEKTTRTNLATTQNNLATTQTNLSNLTTRVSTAESNITSANTRINTANTNITNVTNRVTTIEGELTANSKRIYMDYKNGKYGINTAAGRGADTFIPFKTSQYDFYQSRIVASSYSVSSGNETVATLQVPMSRTVSGKEQWLYSFDFEIAAWFAGEWAAGAEAYIYIWKGPANTGTLLHHFTAGVWGTNPPSTDTGGYTSPYELVQTHTITSNSWGYLTFVVKGGYGENGTDPSMGHAYARAAISNVKYIEMP